MANTEFEVGGQRYVALSLDATKQFLIVKRLGINFGLLGDRSKEAGLVSGVTPFMLAIGALNDADALFIRDTCLGAVRRLNPNNTPAPMIAGGKLMFEDTPLVDLVQIVVQVLEANVGNFIADLREQLQSAIKKVQSSNDSQMETIGSSGRS